MLPGFWLIALWELAKVEKYYFMSGKWEQCDPLVTKCHKIGSLPVCWYVDTTLLNPLS